MCAIASDAAVRMHVHIICRKLDLHVTTAKTYSDGKRATSNGQLLSHHTYLQNKSAVHLAYYGEDKMKGRCLKT